MRRLFLFVAGAIFSLSAAATIASELTVTDGQVRVPMPGRTVTAGYFTLQNNTAAAVSLLAVQSPAFEKAELHQHTHQDGVMRMEQVAQIDIAANSVVTLQPGGLHLMLFNPMQPLLVGESVTVTLSFSNGEQLSLSMPLTEMPRR
jgi:copper(I)-binding protein